MTGLSSEGRFLLVKFYSTPSCEITLLDFILLSIPEERLAKDVEMSSLLQQEVIRRVGVISQRSKVSLDYCFFRGILCVLALGSCISFQGAVAFQRPMGSFVLSRGGWVNRFVNIRVVAPF